MLSEMSTASSSEVLEENGLNGTSSENNNENAKKVKLNNGSSSNNGDDMLQENNTKPSRVVHIRNIPSDVTETEIVHLGIPFGRVSNVLVLKVFHYQLIFGCCGDGINKIFLKNRERTKRFWSWLTSLQR